MEREKFRRPQLKTIVFPREEHINSVFNIKLSILKTCTIYFNSKINFQRSFVVIFRYKCTRFVYLFIYLFKHLKSQYPALLSSQSPPTASLCIPSPHFSKKGKAPSGYCPTLADQVSAGQGKSSPRHQTRHPRQENRIHRQKINSGTASTPVVGGPI